MQSKMNILEEYIYYYIYQITNDYIIHDCINNKDFVDTGMEIIYLKYINIGRYIRKYFICPDCKKIYTYLYLVNNEIKCRKCHNLYYESQLYNRW